MKTKKSANLWVGAILLAIGIVIFCIEFNIFTNSKEIWVAIFLLLPISSICIMLGGLFLGMSAEKIPEFYYFYQMKENTRVSIILADFESISELAAIDYNFYVLANINGRIEKLVLRKMDFSTGIEIKNNIQYIKIDNQLRILN